ncbi:MAG: non-ribosomal peptide synthetase [Actinomycetota bacterium]
MRETPTEVLPRIAASHPERAALEWGSRTITYGELDESVDRLAGFLACAIGPHGCPETVAPRIGIRATELPAMATAFLAIARCGFVSVPLDPASPGPRLAAILDDVGASLVLADDAAADDQLSAFVAARVVRIDDAIERGRPYGAPARVDDDAVVSIIFTSGSTGRPKGVMSSRRLLVDSMDRNRLIGLAPGAARFGLPVAGTVGNFERVMLSAAVGDGATLVGYDVRTQGVQPLAEWLRTQRIEHFAIVPTLLRALLETLSPQDCFPQLRTVVTWGESVAWSDAARLRRHLGAEATLLVTYRSTEASGVAYMAVDAQTPIGSGLVPAGVAMPGVELRIVDDAGADVGPGTEGRILVARGDIASGYWQLPDATALVFGMGGDGTRSCTTGDLGTIDEAGRLVVTGRADEMVKISGNRVDLGEIEFALRAVAGIEEAAVVGRADESGDLRLAAFVTYPAGLSLDGAEVRRELREVLPGFMVPDTVEVLAELPRLSNGKLDRRSLRELPSAPEPALDEGDEPRDDLERALASIWQRILGVPISRSASFAELGGDSVRAARMFARVERQLGYDRPVSLLLQAPTVAALAAALLANDGADAWTPMVLVRAGRDLQPLFVVHGAGGDVMFAALLAGHLDDDRPVYGLRPSVLSGRPLQETTVEELAATYLAAIRTVQPDGPYAIFGYSLGARIGFEIARQLRAGGSEVSLLALGDAPAPGFDIVAAIPPTGIRWRRRIAEAREEGAPSAQIYRTLSTRLVRRSIRRWYGHAVEVASTRRIDAMLGRGEAVPPVLRNDFSVSQLRVLSRRYAPAGPIDVPVLLIRTDQVPDVPDLGWSDLAPDLRIERVRCVHLDLIREPHVAVLAAILQRHLAACDVRSAITR